MEAERMGAPRAEKIKQACWPHWVGEDGVPGFWSKPACPHQTAARALYRLGTSWNCPWLTAPLTKLSKNGVGDWQEKGGREEERERGRKAGKEGRKEGGTEGGREVEDDAGNFSGGKAKYLVENPSPSQTSKESEVTKISGQGEHQRGLHKQSPHLFLASTNTHTNQNKASVRGEAPSSVGWVNSIGILLSTEQIIIPGCFVLSLVWEREEPRCSPDP